MMENTQYMAEYKMITTHIEHAQNIHGGPLSLEQIEVGVIALVKIKGSELISCECISVQDSFAIFRDISSLAKKITMEFNVVDLTEEQFEQLNEALKIFNTIGEQPTERQQSLVHKAHILGYAYSAKPGLAHWTRKGIKKYKSINRKLNSEGGKYPSFSSSQSVL